NHWDVAPDIMCLGKALGGGVMPLSAFMSTPKIWKVLEPNPFIHSSTFGGNPLACAAGIAAINVTLNENLPDKAAKSGKYLMGELKKIQKENEDFLIDVRGLGLLIGLEFIDSEFGYAIAAGLFKRGILVAGTLLNSKTIRIEPALNISKRSLDYFLEVFRQTIKSVKKGW
nr:aminotransferase class III-fold pyridoxal phosphate-dependent enzyme [Candidatus Wallbacteria bacterium]